MSLEQALAENTAAIRELITALSTNPVAAPVPVPVPEETRKPETVADAEPEKKKPEAKKEAEKEAEKEKTPEPAPEKAPEQPTYQETAAAITKLSRAKGRDAALAVLAQFNAAKLPEVDPSQFSAVLAAVQEAMA